MSGLNKAIAAIALVASGIAIGWGLASQMQRDRGSDVLPSPPESPVAAMVEPPTPQVAAVTGSGASTNPVREIPAYAPASAPRPWPQTARSFSEQADVDPILSWELQTMVQRSIDTVLDRNLFEVDSVTCRGSTCQILSFGETERDGPTWSQVFAPILRDVTKATTLHPTTRAELEPTMQSISVVPRSGSVRGFVTVISFN
jgi:hypothetical protein